MTTVETVVVSFNTRALTEACLASLARHTPGVPVTVVDNASTDGTAEAVHSRFPGVRLVAEPVNRGFAAAVNRGVSLGTAPRVFVLNADVELLDDPLPALVRALDAGPRRAAAAPALVYPDRRPQENREPFPSVGAALAGFLGGGARRRGPEPAGEEVPAGAARPAWYPMGAAVLFRRAALEAVGPLDEAYFFYLEEVDWFRRAATAGWGWVRVPGARVVHHLGASLRGVDPVLEARVKRNWYRSRLRYARRHEGGGRGLLLRAGSLPFLAANALRHGVRAALGGSELDRLRARTAGQILGDYLLARVERC